MPRFARPRLPGPALTWLSRPAGRRCALPAAVLLALVIVFTVAWATQPGNARVAGPGGQTVAVTSVTRSCPPSGSGSATSRIAVVAAGAGTGKQAAVPTGTATFAAVLAAPSAASGSAGGKAAKGKASTSAKAPASKTPASKAAGKPASAETAAPGPVTVSVPGTAKTITTPGAGTAVAASGKMAEGFEAEQADASGTGLVSCTYPGSDMWLVGTGQDAGAPQIRLYLTNTGTVTASADITIFTDTGQQSGLSSAVTVLPDQSVTENIAPFVAGSQALALHIQTTAGQVSAAAWEGDAKSGAWLPQTAAPSTTQVIPGLTVASSAARLFVVVPGATNAQVKVVAFTPSGAVNQFPGEPVDASAGAATPVALSSLGASAAGLELTSNVPIVASVLVPGAGIGSFTTGVSALTEQGVVAGNPATRGDTVGVLLTAPSAAGRASISVISADGAVTKPAADQSVAVAAGRTVAVAVPRAPGGRIPFAIVVTPAAGSGPLYAARVVTSGAGGLSAPLVSLLPVPSVLTSVTLPPAANSYTAVLP